MLDASGHSGRGLQRFRQVHQEVDDLFAEVHATDDTYEEASVQECHKSSR